MLNVRLKAAHSIAAKLLETEEAIDRALTSAAELSALMPSVRLEAKLAATVAQPAMLASAEMITALVQARHLAVVTHEKLDDAKTQIGLRTVAVGGGMVKPPMAEGEPHIRAVA